MEKIINLDAVAFYNKLLEEKIIVENDNMRERLTEVNHWKQSFITLMTHASHFHITLLNKEKLIILLNKYNIDLPIIHN